MSKHGSPNTMIHPSACIGNAELHGSVTVGPFCIIAFPPEKMGVYPNSPFGVKIKEGAVLTGLVTVDAGTIRHTVIGERCFLMKHSHVGHDTLLHEDVILSCGAKIGGHCILHRGVNVGLNASIHPRQVIAPYVMIGANSFVTKNLETKPFCIYAGNPAKFIKFNQRAVEKAGLTPAQVTEITQNFLNGTYSQNNQGSEK